MKFVILVALTIVSISVVPVLSRTALGQQDVCGTNPDPVDAADPSIIVSSPASGASVTSPLHVEGQARVFEATVNLRLIRADGSEGESTAQAAEGGVLSAFSTDISFSVSAAESGCLWVYEASAQDGSPTNVVQIPLTLNPSTGLPPTGTGAEQPGASLTAWVAGALMVVGVGLSGAALARRRR